MAHPVIWLPAHPASFTWFAKFIFQPVPGCNGVADLSCKILFWSHKFVLFVCLICLFVNVPSPIFQFKQVLHLNWTIYETCANLRLKCTIYETCANLRLKCTIYETCGKLRLECTIYECVLKRVSFGSKDCTKELKLECACFLGQTS